MNPLIGLTNNKVNILDSNISEYAKYEAAKDELAFVLYMLEKTNKDSQEYIDLNQRGIDLNAYLSKKTKKEGCYIATMAYGDYNHPKVRILRKFRDEVLGKSAFGKWFIKTYYHYSPKLVERLKNQKTLNIIIRKALNQFIKLIK